MTIKSFPAFFLILLFLCLIGDLYGTHNRAGEIRLEQIGELRLRATIVTYTKASSVDADRDSLRIDWGDGNNSIVGRINGNGQGEIIGNDIKMNIYIGEHTFPGRGTYTISMMDPNRIAGIRNVNFPNSVIVPFYIESSFTFLNPQFQGFNNSVVLLNPPLDFACVGRRFIHNPNAYDPDGDSLSYELVVPMETNGEPVPRYEFPDQVVPGPDNNISLDPVTGDFVWDSPQLAGEYNIAIRINEFRNGNLINYTIRDMQINVRDNCESEPPEIEAADELCVIAGDTINELVIATDPDRDPRQLVRLSASGGPFEQEFSPARFEILNGFQEHPLEGRFIWETICNHISGQSYTVIYKAEDNTFNTAGLVELRQFRIKVSGPPPQNLRTSGGLNEIELRWDQPYACEETFNNYFNGFTIWRKEGISDLEIDTCGTDPADAGFVPIGFGVTNLDDESYFFNDRTAEKGKVYCYRVTAEFALRTDFGNYPFNRVQSLPSEEVCDQLGRDVPLIVEVSVLETNPQDGSIQISWTKPVVGDLDTLEFPGPYRYQLLRSTGLGNTDFSPVPGADFSSPTFSGANDTTFIDSDIDTENLPYTYTVAFYAGSSIEYGRSVPASSLRLNATGANRVNRLNWEAVVPWNNYSFELYLTSRDGEILELLEVTDNSEYVHQELENESEYCYLVRSEGTYGLSDIRSPLFNFSQVICSVPIDTIPPCPPVLEVENICNALDDSGPIDEGDLVNTLKWSLQDCGEGGDNEDLAGFQIYYASSESESLEFFEEVSGNTFTITHSPESGLIGCYAVRAIDLSGNISPFSNIVCKNNCPVYNLPNAFTPNGDGHNDLFVPFEPYLFVERVEFEVYNRWGQKVFETTNPEINWDGTNFNGQDLSEGTYHYRAKVFFRTTDTIESSRVLTGFIQLIR
ncbi:MAG: gliding motility-associated C-terminal domain-containing protein [Saprospirales bacterium]|nr:MAG: gliding motility-associated C-terminal domain-containing protein [Saprospirales bacterium]